MRRLTRKGGNMPLIVTQNLQITRALAALIDAALVDATPAAIFDVTSKIHLYTDGPLPAFDTDVSAFTEATFTGSTALTIATMLGPINFPGPNQGLHKEFDWICTVAPTPVAQVVKGIFITDATSTVLLAAEQFVQPVNIAIPGDAISYDLVLMPRTLWGGQNG